MSRNRVQNALRQRKQEEANTSQAIGQKQERAYDCFFHHDDLPSPMENGTLCTLPLKQLDGFPDHEEHFPLYTGQRLDDMVDSIRRLGVQTPILVWKTNNGCYIIISGHNRVNASILAGRATIPAVVRTDLTMETAEDLFFEMNFRQRSLADMLFSQRVLCVAAHYNMKSVSWKITTFKNVSISTFPPGNPQYLQQKGKKLRALFGAGNLDAAQIKAILTEEIAAAKRPGRRISVTLSADFEEYFPRKATAREIEETIQKALELYFKTTKSSS